MKIKIFNLANLQLTEEQRSLIFGQDRRLYVNRGSPPNQKERKRRNQGEDFQFVSERRPTTSRKGQQKVTTEMTQFLVTYNKPMKETIQIITEVYLNQLNS